jgi:hypothetical protein
VSRWRSARLTSTDGRQRHSNHMASSGMPPGHRKQLPEEQIQALTALLDKHATATARLSRGDLVADR